MDAFSTNGMMKAVNQLPMTNNFLLKRFFRNVQQEQTEKIHFDVIKKTRRLAPFVSPLVKGKVVESQGFETNTFEPAYIKDKRIFDSSRPLKRSAGENIGGTFTPMHRVERLLVSELTDQVNMVDRRLEVMACEVLRTGSLIITGDSYPTQNINFNRDAELTITLPEADKWNDPVSTPLDDLQDWSQMIMQKTGVFANDVVMSVDIWKIFRKHPQVSAELERFKGDTTLIAEALNTEGGALMGNIQGFNIFVYSAWYIDDAGIEQPILPNGSVILSSPKMEGIRAFGAIRDDSAGYQALPYYPKSWVVEDPSVRYLLMQSAPLLVPAIVDASLYAKVM